METAHDPDDEYEPITFELAKGAKVRVAMGEFWEQLSESDLALGHKPSLYFAIRIYSDEDTYPRRMVQHTEFRAGHDFDQGANRRLWTWVTDLTASRHRFIYDTVEDFLEELAARMDEYGAIADDAADVIHRNHGTPPPYEDPEHDPFIEDQDFGAAAEVSAADEEDGGEEVEAVLGGEEDSGDNEAPAGDDAGEQPNDDNDEPQP